MYHAGYASYSYNPDHSLTTTSQRLAMKQTLNTFQSPLLDGQETRGGKIWICQMFGPFIMRKYEPPLQILVAGDSLGQHKESANHG
jgi:hypothetical protein